MTCYSGHTQLYSLFLSPECFSFPLLQSKKLPQLLHGIIRTSNRMSNCPLIFKNLIIIPSFISPITKEVNLFETFLFNMV